MSKLVLQRRACEQSNVTVDESNAIHALQPSIIARIGNQGVHRLVALFYERVFNDTESWFLNIFASSTKSEAIDHLYRFLVQTWGGDHLYQELRGRYTRLAGRHANYNIGPAAANRWVGHMMAAVVEHPLLRDDQEATTALRQYFLYTAHYIVVAKEYMRGDQLSGGTQMDAGRIW